MLRTRLAWLALVVLALAGLALPAQAHDESEAEEGPLEVEARPAIALVGETVTVEAEYEPDDDGDSDDGESDDGDSDDGESDDGDEVPDDGIDDGIDDGLDDGDQPDDDGTDEDDGINDGDDSDDGDENSDPVGLQFAAVFTVDFGDGSGPQPMTITDSDDEGEAEAIATHAYAAEGDYDVTVTVTPAGGTPVSATVVVNVGAGSARLDGSDRFGTANRLSREDFPTDGSASAVLLARADQFADALASAGMAVLSEAPVLLTNTDQVPGSVIAEIERALGDDGTVYLLGGEAAIAPQVATALQELGYQVVRIAGDDRVDTALQIARFVIDAGVEVDEVVLASATTFPDALAGAAYAASQEAPVLLTAPHALDPRVADFLTTVGTDTDVLVAGGNAAVSDEVVAELQALGFEVERLHGADRFATAAQIAERLFDDATVVVIATGGNFPDALAGAAQAGRVDAPILLVGDTLPEPVRAYLQEHADQITVAYVLGGPAVVPQPVVEEIQAILGLD